MFLIFRPQTTIGTAMVLCHRFFVRRSHASHDRFVSFFSMNVTSCFCNLVISFFLGYLLVCQNWPSGI